MRTAQHRLCGRQSPPVRALQCPRVCAHAARTVRRQLSLAALKRQTPAVGLWGVTCGQSLTGWSGEPQLKHFLKEIGWMLPSRTNVQTNERARRRPPRGTSAPQRTCPSARHAARRFAGCMETLRAAWRDCSLRAATCRLRGTFVCNFGLTSYPGKSGKALGPPARRRSTHRVRRHRMRRSRARSSSSHSDAQRHCSQRGRFSLE